MASSSFPHPNSLALTNEEAELLYTPDFGWDFAKEDPKLFLIGCFISSKPIDIYAVLSAFEGIWKPINLVSISVIKDNFLKIKFKENKDRYEVLNRGPWLYKDEWLALTEYNPPKSTDNYSFTIMRIWIRIFGLPTSLFEDIDRSHLVGHALGSMVGNVLRTDTREFEGNMTEFLRVEIMLDVTRPVTRFLFTGNGSDKTMCRLQYEHLPTLCHDCGIVSHTIDNCPTRASLDLTKLQYGEWLRYLPPRRRPLGPRGRIRTVGAECNQTNPIPSGPTSNAPEPIDQNNIGNLNEGDTASFSEQPVEEAPNADVNMYDAPPSKDANASGSKLKNTQSRSNPQVSLPPRTLEPQPLNTIFPISEDASDDDWDAQDDSIPSPTAQQIKKFDVDIPNAPAPTPTNRGTKRRSPIQVVLQPKKAKPSGSTPKAGISSSKNSPAVADCNLLSPA